MNAPEIIGRTIWEGYDRTDFLLNEHPGHIIHPKKPLPGNPWVWRAEFFGAFDTADRALLAKGWHIAYYKLSDMYGCPEAVEQMKLFHDAAAEHFSLDPKADLFGFSRGGLYSVNYAASYPEDIAVLYLDAPVLDIRSWPGGLGDGVGAPKQWEECLGWYRLSEEDARSFDRNPLDRIPELIAGNIPIMLVAGGADSVVPYHENGMILHKEYTMRGGRIRTIVKPDCEHHPHSLEDPAPIVEMIEQTRLERLSR